MEELKKPFLSVNQSVEKCLICIKDIRANDALSLVDDGWKIPTNLAVWFYQSIISITSMRKSMS